MEAERFLRQLRSREIMILRGYERLREMEMALLPSGISYDGVRVQTSPTDKMSEGIARICDEYAKLQRRIARDQEIKREVEGIVERLDPVKMEIAFYRYRDGLLLTEIAPKINYSYTQTLRLWKQLLKEVEVMISEKDTGGDSTDDADELPGESGK